MWRNLSKSLDGSPLSTAGQKPTHHNISDFIGGLYLTLMLLTTGCGGGWRGYLDVHGLAAAQGQVGAGRDAGPRVLRPPRGQDAGHGGQGHRAIGVTPHYRGSLPRSRGLGAPRVTAIICDPANLEKTIN